MLHQLSELNSDDGNEKGSDIAKTKRLESGVN